MQPSINSQIQGFSTEQLFYPSKSSCFHISMFSSSYLQHSIPYFSSPFSIFLPPFPIIFLSLYLGFLPTYFTVRNFLSKIIPYSVCTSLIQLNRYHSFDVVPNCRDVLLKSTDHFTYCKLIPRLLLLVLSMLIYPREQLQVIVND